MRWFNDERFYGFELEEDDTTATLAVYRGHLRALEERLPTGLAPAVRRGSLHDAEIEVLETTPSKSKVHPIVGAGQPEPGRMDLVYQGARLVTSDFAHLAVMIDAVTPSEGASDTGPWLRCSPTRSMP